MNKAKIKSILAPNGHTVRGARPWIAAKAGEILTGTKETKVTITEQVVYNWLHDRPNTYISPDTKLAIKRAARQYIELKELA